MSNNKAFVVGSVQLVTINTYQTTFMNDLCGKVNCTLCVVVVVVVVVVVFSADTMDTIQATVLSTMPTYGMPWSSPDGQKAM